jgi:hypothetical protein
MGGMMGGGQVPNLKQLDPEDRVRSINHCGDTYKIATEDGKTRDFWERKSALQDRCELLTVHSLASRPSCQPEWWATGLT